MPVNLKPIPFVEAIQFARSRKVVLPEPYYGALQNTYRTMSFSIKGVARIDQLTHVRNLLAKYIKDGKTFENFKTDIRAGKLALDLPDYRLDNIYRTNIQTAYQHGRCERHKDTEDTHPYLMYSATDDFRVRKTHYAMHKHIALKSDQIWLRWTPLCGYRCRCTTIGLTESQANSRGISNKIPSIDGAIVEPDEGWDHSPCGDGVTKGVDKAKDRAKKQAPKLAEKIDQAEKPKFSRKEMGVLFDLPPVKTANDVKNVLLEYAKLQPDNLPHGLKDVVFTNAKYMMATDTRGTFKVSTKKAPYMNNASTKQKLLDAMQKIRRGKELDFLEEYAVESLWHEINHNRQAWDGWTHKINSVGSDVMEIINQLYSRHTYDDFLKALGGRAKYKDQVIEGGIGYRKMVANFRTLLREIGIDDAAIVADLERINLGYAQTATTRMAKFLAEKTGILQDNMIRLIVASRNTRVLVYEMVKQGIVKNSGVE